MTVKELINILSSYKPDTHCAHIIFMPDDIHTLAEEADVKLTDEEVNNILDTADHKADAGDGLNWDILQIHMEWEIAKRNEK